MANKTKYEYKLNPVYLLAAVLVILMAIAAVLMLNTYAKYITTADGTDSARVAKFEISDTGSMYETSFALEVDPIQPAAVNDALTLTNNSEVDVKCCITVDSTANLPLIFEWTDEDGNKSSVPADEAAEFTLESNGDSSVYDLAVKWDTSTDDNKSFTYRRQVDSISLTVKFEQID